MRCTIEWKGITNNICLHYADVTQTAATTSYLSQFKRCVNEDYGIEVRLHGVNSMCKCYKTNERVFALNVDFFFFLLKTN